MLASQRITLVHDALVGRLLSLLHQFEILQLGLNSKGNCDSAKFLEGNISMSTGTRKSLLKLYFLINIGVWSMHPVF
jgi:hypothetical protein